MTMQPGDGPGATTESHLTVSALGRKAFYAIALCLVKLASQPLAMLRKIRGVPVHHVALMHCSTLVHHAGATTGAFRTSSCVGVTSCRPSASLLIGRGSKRCHRDYQENESRRQNFHNVSCCIQIELSAGNNRRISETTLFEFSLQQRVRGRRSQTTDEGSFFLTGTSLSEKPLVDTRLVRNQLLLTRWAGPSRSSVLANPILAAQRPAVGLHRFRRGNVRYLAYCTPFANSSAELQPTRPAKEITFLCREAGTSFQYVSASFLLIR